MNIAMISLYLPSGCKIGSGYQAHYLANALVRRGHRVTMFSPCERPDDAAYDHVVVPVGERMRTFRFAWNLRKMGLWDFDVVHAHGDDYWLWGRGKPAHVRTMHGSCFAEARHVPGFKGKVRMLLLGLSEVAATWAADRTACVSADTRRYYPWVCDVVHNGVDLSAFRPAPGEHKEPHPTILFVGTYRNRKRGSLLMEAFERTIRPALPEARLWMVCEDAPEAPGVSVLGRVPLEELCELYRRAWVFCLPSSYEGFGVPYIEAMASGTPVVATPNPGAREVLDGGRCGVITEPGRLGPALLQVLQVRDERDRLREVGLGRAREFGWDRVVDRYEEMYRDIAGGRRFRRAAAQEIS